MAGLARIGLGCIALIAGCGFGIPDLTGTDGDPGDADVADDVTDDVSDDVTDDVSDDVPPPLDGPGVDAMPTCHGVELVACAPVREEQLTIRTGETALVNTDGDSCAAGATVKRGTADIEACVVAFLSIQIEGTLRVRGTRPLVLVSVGSVAISGLVDASAEGNMPGPGGDESCPSQPAGDNGGGQGGSFADRGGAGGAGSDGGGGANTAIESTNGLHGGCQGRDGGSNGPQMGRGGRGGGGIGLITDGALTISGTIVANGSPGGGGGGGTPGDGGGGGGGGSGGMILLDAAGAAAISGVVWAQGAGGGAGGADLDGGNGSPPMQPSVPAPGGTSSENNAGDGGNGAGDLSLTGEDGGDGQDEARGGGGGGGGGSAGYIRIVAADVDESAGSVSPPRSN